MASESAKFVNNLGTLSFSNCLIEIADDWQWSGGIVTRARRIRLTGVVRRAEFDAFDEMSSTRAIGVGVATEPGQRGVLTLPWTSIAKMKLQSIDMPGDTWLHTVNVTAEFVDDDPDSSKYECSFFGITLINPRFVLQLPFRSVRDEYVQMPISGGTIINTLDATFGAIRSRQTYDNMRCVLSGTHLIEEDFDVQKTVEILAHRGGTNNVASTGLPPGYPAYFNMADLSPELATHLPLTNLWVIDSTLAWSFERDQADVTVQMECPPQLLA